MKLKILIVLFLIITVTSNHEVFGHGIGSETLAAKMIGERQVFIQVNAVNVKDSEINQEFTFTMMNMKTGEALKEITYEIEASKQNQILFHETFESSSGTLVMQFIDNNDSEKINVEKQSAGIFDFLAGGADTVRVEGPYFDYGGLYQFVIRIHTIDSFSNKISPVLEWNAGISLADITQYTVDDINFGKQILNHTTYYDLIENFQYDQVSKNITFEMPFDASLDSINQTSVIHEEIALSKDFGDLMVSEISATVNGILMPKEVIAIDDFIEEKRIIHLTMIKNNIMQLYDQNKLENNRLSFAIYPSEPNLPLSTVTKNGQFKIILGPQSENIKPGQEIQLQYKILDVFLKDKPIKVDYKMYVSQEGKILFQTNGISNDEVGKFESAKFLIPEDITGIIYVNFDNLAGNSLANARLPIVIDRTVLEQENEIPDWIRSNASLWSQELITDNEFVNGIEFLIKEGIINTSSSSSENITSDTNEIPDWIRSNASLWSQELITDNEFVNGIEFLIKEGIIQV